MGLSLQYTLPNGVVLNYHRIVSLITMVGVQTTIEVAGYTSQEKREEELLKRIAELQSDLDDELGWEPCKDMGTAVSQEDYLKLAKGNKPMTDEEAKDLVCGEFGFDKGKIEIIREVHTYEANKHRHTRKAASFRRDPYYEATDWFYVRFNVKGYTTWQWEADGLELKPYCT